MSANEPGQPAPAGATPSTWRHNLPTPTSALAIGAHPDDVEFGCGGTLAKWAQAGCTIHHLVLTDGSKGTWDAQADPVVLAARRQAEQREAARRLADGSPGETVFLEYVDGELPSDLTARGRVAEVIRRLRPAVILGHDPWKLYRIHPDHRHAGLLACEGVVAARDPHFFPEHGLAPHRPDVLLLWEAERPDHVEDVSNSLDRKLDALEAHVSQFESTMKAVDGDQLAAFRTRVSDRLAGLGAPHGYGAAEVFARLDDL
jgi:LmbE family N-acetylglucosaminyl deacetylase